MTELVLQHFIEDKRDFGLAVCGRISENIAKLGFSPSTDIGLPDYDAARFALVTDPFSQSRDLIGYWYNSSQQPIGQIRFHGDGSFYAEYDVVQRHPRKQQVFVEAINAWGNRHHIKTEVKLFAMP